MHLYESKVTRPRKEAMRCNVPHLPMYCNVVSQPVKSQLRHIAACLANIAIGDTKEDKKEYHKSHHEKTLRPISSQVSSLKLHFGLHQLYLKDRSVTHLIQQINNFRCLLNGKNTRLDIVDKNINEHKGSCSSLAVQLQQISCGWFKSTLLKPAAVLRLIRPHLQQLWLIATSFAFHLFSTCNRDNKTQPSRGKGSHG